MNDNLMQVKLDNIVCNVPFNEREIVDALSGDVVFTERVPVLSCGNWQGFSVV